MLWSIGVHVCAYYGTVNGVVGGRLGGQGDVTHRTGACASISRLMVSSSHFGGMDGFSIVYWAS